jgi:hypothetical protein
MGKCAIELYKSTYCAENDHKEAGVGNNGTLTLSFVFLKFYLPFFETSRNFKLKREIVELTNCSFGRLFFLYVDI